MLKSIPQSYWILVAPTFTTPPSLYKTSNKLLTSRYHLDSATADKWDITSGMTYHVVTTINLLLWDTLPVIIGITSYIVVSASYSKGNYQQRAGGREK